MHIQMVSASQHSVSRNISLINIELKKKEPTNGSKHLLSLELLTLLRQLFDLTSQLCQR